MPRSRKSSIVLRDELASATSVVDAAARKRIASDTPRQPLLTIALPNGKKRKIDHIAEPPLWEPVKVQKLKAHRSASRHNFLNPLPGVPALIRPACALFYWGEGSIGQFGVPGEEVGRPKKNAWVEEHIRRGSFGGEGSGFVAIAAGGLHSLFLDEKGTVWSCGNNDGAALGRQTDNVPDPHNTGSVLDDDELSTTPHPVQSLVDEKFRTVKIAAGDNLSVALSETGYLRVWGSLRNTEGPISLPNGQPSYKAPTSILQLPYNEKVADVACGAKHLVILTTHGNVYTWGVGDFGQLGISPPLKQVVPPRRVNLHRRVTLIGAGDSVSFALDEQGDVWGWGLNAHGQTCTGELDELMFLPKRVQGVNREALGSSKVVQMEGGEFHSLFLLDDGRVFVCGRSLGGELGLGKDHPALVGTQFLATPTQLVFSSKVIHIEAGARRSMAIMETGELFCWGEGSQSELGLGKNLEQSDEPTVLDKSGALLVSCGGQHTIALFRSV